ncbi:DUF2651 family protein [Bacillus gobiensis]|nr:DUF2651 family protein [Bacillus gobiensis]
MTTVKEDTDINPLLNPAYFLLLILPAFSFVLGIIGYLIFKKVWIMVVIVLIFSLGYMFIEIGPEPTFLIWVSIMTGACFISGLITKSIANLIKR